LSAGLTVCLLVSPDPERDGVRTQARASVAFAGEVLEVESGGSASERARRLSAAIARARHPFVFVLAENEALSQALAKELQAVLARGPGAQGYRVPRRGRYLGRSILCPEWQGMGPVRLIDRRATFAIDPERGAIAVLGEEGELRGELHGGSPLFLQGMIRDITLATRGATGPPPPPRRLFTAPMIELWRSFLRRGAVGGGRAALFLATMDSFYVLVTLARQWAAQPPAQPSASQR
jgi:hypothetical protein